jgi:hypothetical protein
MVVSVSQKVPRFTRQFLEKPERFRFPKPHDHLPSRDGQVILFLLTTRGFPPAKKNFCQKKKSSWITAEPVAARRQVAIADDRSRLCSFGSECRDDSTCPRALERMPVHFPVVAPVA